MNNLENKNRKNILLIIAFVGFLFALGAFLYFRVYTYSIIILLITLLILSLYLDNQKKKENDEFERELNEYKNLFKGIDELSLISKERILEFELPLKLRNIIEKSLSLEVSIDEFDDLIKSKYPFHYQRMLNSLYQLVINGRKDEWEYNYNLFLKEEQNTLKRKQRNKWKEKESLPVIALAIFSVVIIIFLYPVLKEVIYG